MMNTFKREKMRMPLRARLRRMTGLWFLLLIIAMIPVFLWFLM